MHRGLTALLVLFPLLAGPQNTVPKDAPPYSDKEIALGTALARRTERTEKLLDDVDAAAYVQSLGDALAKAAGLGGSVTVRVIDRTESYALAFPGGRLYLSTGLLARTENESELAGVLAHLIAHLAAGHRMHSIASRPGSSRYDLVFVDFFGTAGSSCLRLMKENEVPSGWIIRYGAAEKKADLLAAGYLHDARFDPLSLPEFFNKLRYAEPRLADRYSSKELIETRTQIEDKFPPRPKPAASSESYVRTRARVAAAVKQVPAPTPTPGQRTQ